MSQGNTFTRIVSVTHPTKVKADPATGKNPAFDISFKADGEVPFPQIIIRAAGKEYLFNGKEVKKNAEFEYKIRVPEGLFYPCELDLQVEGCTKANFVLAAPSDWIKVTSKILVESITISFSGGSGLIADAKIYFSIHKHMHQPYYDAVNLDYWDGEKDQIFGSRAGPYRHFVPAAVRQYIDGELPHAGLSTSWSGSLIEQLTSCERTGRCGGVFSGWNWDLRELAKAKTVLGNPRMDFTAFGFFHPLMALIPARDIVKQIKLHRDVIRNAFGVEASPMMFPPETAFHIRMIPALIEAGVEAVIYDSIHRFRACKDYPYAGLTEGMLPPNAAEQENPPVNDWLQLNNIWAGSKISPSLLRPEYVKYEDPDGKIHKIIGVPAERYIGNEDARGGFGALQYPSVLEQVRQRIIQTGSFDPRHPPFFVLHSDGDNHGGGADSYYTHNTGQLVEWLKQDKRFELISVRDYLQMFPPDPDKAVHIEPGSWSGADNGDPQFKKWFSRYTEKYSPDLNSWAVLTALQNIVHATEDTRPDAKGLEEATRLMLTAETSCYWYWTGQTVWDSQVTNAANRAIDILNASLRDLIREDKTAPTIFSPWVTPENPGGKTWGNNCLVDAEKQATVHSFVYDISGLNAVTLVLRTASGENRIKMTDNGPYPSQTGAKLSGNYFTAKLPVNLGDVRYYIEAIDKCGNIAKSALERIFLP